MKHRKNYVAIEATNTIEGTGFISSLGKFGLLKIYLYRVLTRTGPHGKKCRCPKWGGYVGGCPSPDNMRAVLAHAGIRFDWAGGITCFDNVKIRSDIRYQPGIGIATSETITDIE